MESNAAALAIVGFLAALSVPFATASAVPPHIVIVLADDLGYGDAGAFNAGSKIATPHMDRLAVQGMRFGDAHAAGSVCVPSRYGLLTGRYPFRAHMGWQTGPVIEPGRMTLASLLKDAGYATAMIGKWHLGFEGGEAYRYDAPLRGGPLDRGFDTFFGIPASADQPPYFIIEGRGVTAAPSRQLPAGQSEGWSPIQGAFWRAGPAAPGFRMEELLPRLTERAVERIRGWREGAPPLFLYLALSAPHTPWLPSPRWRGQSEVELYGDFVMQVDDSLGRVLAALRERGISDDSVVLFTSDNGPAWYPRDVERFGHAASGPWRGMKGDAYEGGHRVPFVVRWPGVVEPGSRWDEPVSLCDVFATAAGIVGRSLPSDVAEDSFSLLPVLRGEEGGYPERGIVTLSLRGLLSIRQQSWKLVQGLGSGGFSLPFRIRTRPGDPAGQLYDLAADPGERKNLYQARPEVVERLSALLDRYTAEGRSRE